MKMSRRDEFYAGALKFEHSLSASGRKNTIVALEPGNDSFGRNIVGTLSWDNNPQGQPGIVSLVRTVPERRRMGVATALWQQAHQMASQGQVSNPPKHSPVKTAEGEAWAAGMANKARAPRRRPTPSRKPSTGQESMF